MKLAHPLKTLFCNFSNNSYHPLKWNPDTIILYSMIIECTLVHEEITLKRDSFRNETSISMIKQFRIQQSNWLPFYSLNDKMRYSVLWTIYHSNSIWSQIWMTDIYYKLKLFFAYNPCWHTFSSHSISVYLTCNFTYKCK